MKSRRSTKQRVTVKQKISLQYAVAAGCALAAVVGVAVFAYLNVGNSTDSLAANAHFYAVQPGHWSSASVWQENVAPPPGEIKHDVEVLSRVVRRGHLRYPKGTKKTLIVKDTLLVEGNLTLGNKSNLTIHEGGVLMIGGDFRVDKKSEIANYGVIAVGGDWSVRSLNKITYLGDQHRFFHFGKVQANGESAQFGQGEEPLRQAHAAVYAQVKRASDRLKPILFTAAWQGGQVVTRWVTPGETAHAYFTVEKSTNGMLFSELATVGGDTNSLMPNQRTYTDEHPAEGISYYRLRRTDADNNTMYSKLVMVASEESAFSLNGSARP